MEKEFDRERARKTIMSHYISPKFKVALNDSQKTHSVRQNPSNCSDDLLFDFRIVDEKLEDIGFTGTACSISLSTSDMVAEKVKGMTLKEISSFLIIYKGLIEGEDVDLNLLGELDVFQTVHYQANRKNCAMMVHNALMKITKEGK